MKICVTGSKGYIGSEIFFRLQMKGLNPIGIDLKDGKDVRRNMPKCADVVIHCAATLKNRGSLKYNVALTKAVIKHTKKIIFLSSAAVYGEITGEPFVETDPVAPINEYGKSKVFCEDLIKNSGIDYTILRLSNVYSLHATHGVVAKFLKGIRIIYGVGDQVRDFVLLDDVVRAVMLSIPQGSLMNNSIVNISSGDGLTINELYSRICPEYPAYHMKTTRQEIRSSVLSGSLFWMKEGSNYEVFDTNPEL